MSENLNWVFYFTGFVLITHLLVVYVLAYKRGGMARQERELPSDKTNLGRLTLVILIPAWDESTTIQRCLQGLRNQSVSNWTAIVVAGGEDNTFQIAEKLASEDSRMKVIKQSPAGKNAALRQALNKTEAEIIILLDADSVVEPNWLDSLLYTLHSGYDAVTGNYLPLRSTWVSEAEQVERISSYFVNNRFKLQGGGSIAVYRDGLEKAGGFPEDVLVGVDWDLDARIKEAGFSCGFAHDAIVYTERPSSLQSYWKNEVRWRRGHLAILLRKSNDYLAEPVPSILSYRFYIAAFIALIALLLMVAGAVVWIMAGWFYLFWLAFLFLVWLAGRRLFILVEVIAFSNDWRYLRLVAALAILLFVSFAASLWAVVTPARLSAHFQGRRDHQ